MNLHRTATVALAALVGLVVSVALLASVGANPMDALWALVTGSVGTWSKLADTVMAWSPLVLAASGLVITFRAGLWNIGVEGQVTAGAIVATGVARSMGGPGWLVMLSALAAGVAGGALWGMAAGALKVYGNVNEIFGGLGLGYVAQALATFLVIGPWKRAGIASTSGTEPFRDEVWMPTVGSSRLAPLAPLLAVAFVMVVWWMLDRTRLGLELKAVGSNLASARLIGIRSNRVMLSAFGAGGGLAGLAGGVIVMSIQHKLVPAVAGGRGFLSILVVLLAGMGIRAVMPVAFFFAAVSVGASQLSLQFDLDSSLGGVLQGVVVLAALLIGGARRRTEAVP